MIWTILGFSVAIMAVFCISMAETVVGNPFFENLRHYIAAGIGVAGVVAFLIGRTLAARDKKPVEGAEETNRFVLFDLRYWGPMLVALGLITVFIRPLKFAKHEKTVATAPPAPRKPPVVAKVEPPKPRPKPQPATFPNLKMQGVIYHQDHPVVILNGQSYTIGDRLGEVMVRAIERTSVQLELQGQLKTLTIN